MATPTTITTQVPFAQLMDALANLDGALSRAECKGAYTVLFANDERYGVGFDRVDGVCTFYLGVSGGVSTRFSYNIGEMVTKTIIAMNINKLPA